MTCLANCNLRLPLHFTDVRTDTLVVISVPHYWTNGPRGCIHLWRLSHEALHRTFGTLCSL